MITYTLKVFQIIKETADAHTICFKQPTLRKIKYLPGQYITLIITINNRKYKRPYSLSSAPGIDSTLNITVKRLPGGIVSNHLIDILKVDDIIEVIEPMGDFIFNPEIPQNREIYLWGAGSGITPLMAIIKAALHSTNQFINLIYCNKNSENTIFYNQLVQLQNQFNDRINVNFFFTEKEGRIKTDNINQILKNTTIENTTHYICGPISLKDVVKNTLLHYGVISDQIFSEDFEHIIDKNELSNIQTQFVEIITKNLKTKIEVIRGKSILEAALDSGIDLAYSCQTGKCTLCKAKIISGAVQFIGIETPETVIRDNERLLCCSYPLTNNVIFEID